MQSYPYTLDTSGGESSRQQGAYELPAGYAGVAAEAFGTGPSQRPPQPVLPQQHKRQPSIKVKRTDASSSKTAPDAPTAAAANDSGNDDEEANGKRRRVQRACDSCRKKKVRCNGLAPGETSCANCTTYGHECTFIDAAKRRAPPRSYVDALESRMEKMEQLLGQIAPGVDFTERIGPMPRLPGEEDVKPNVPSAAQAVMRQSPPNAQDSRSMALDSVNAVANGSRAVAEQAPQSGDETSEDEDIVFIQTRFAETEFLADGRLPSTLSCVEGKSTPGLIGGENDDSPPLETAPAQYLGKASSFHLLDLLDRISTDNQRIPPPSARTAVLRDIEKQQAQGGWNVRALPVYSMNPSPDKVQLHWPAPDLEAALLDAYFARPHNDFPLVNEATVRRQIHSPEARRRIDVTSLCLGIFCIASRYVNDPRVLPPQGLFSTAGDQAGDGRMSPQHLPGLHWWVASRDLGMCMWGQPVTIEHAQSLILSIFYMFDSPMQSTTPWALLGVAVRLLQDVGAHRKVTAEALKHSGTTAETYKRMWWVLYSMDREFSAGHGRPVAIQDEDFDTEDPIAIDDEFLALADEQGVPAKQPDGQPSKFEGFIATLRLDQIIGRTLRTIYAIGKAKVTRGFVGRHWDQFIVAEIDSALNQWLDTVPAHLRYDPHEPNDEWLIQSALLHTKYYHCQILVHRTFIPGPKTKSTLNFPSLAICTNAARSTSHILHNLRKRGLLARGGFQICMRALSAGCVLLLVVWGAKKSGGRTNQSAMTDVRRCLDVLKELSKTWALAVKFTAVLTRLLEMSELPVPGSLKRSAEDDMSDKEDESMPSVGRSRRKVESRRSENASTASTINFGRPLPLSTSELVDAFDNESAGASPAVSNTSYSAQGSSSAQPRQHMSNSSSLDNTAFQQALSAGMTPMQDFGGMDFAAAFPAANAFNSDFATPDAFRSTLTPNLGGPSAYGVFGGEGERAGQDVEPPFGGVPNPFDSLFSQQPLWTEDWLAGSQSQQNQQPRQ